jgi:hypothetical protein
MTALPAVARAPAGARLLVAWSVLLGGLVGFWLLRPCFDAKPWNDLSVLVLFVTSKFATLFCLSAPEWRSLLWGRLGVPGLCA